MKFHCVCKAAEIRQLGIEMFADNSDKMTEKTN